MYTVMCIYDMWKDLGLPCVCYILYMMCISVFHNNIITLSLHTLLQILQIKKI